MEPPLSPPAAPTVVVAAPPVSAPTSTVVHPHAMSSYPDSVDSSPRSRTTEGLDDLPAPAGGGGTAGVSSKLRLMCSYDGHIIPRPHDKSLCYIGGDTRIVVVDRNISLSALAVRLSNTLLNGRPFTLKYQLPSEDLDSLISVTTDEDLDNMIEEYDRTISSSNSTSGKPSRLRLFLFPSKPEATQSMGQILESSVKSDDWFLNALNSVGHLNRGFSDSDTNINCLLGLDDGLGLRANTSDNGGKLDLDTRDVGGSMKSAQQRQQHSSRPQGGQDIHSAPDSSVLDTTSSFGSTSSSPSLANLPPIRVHVEESVGVRVIQDQKLGIEDQFAQLSVGGGANKQLQQQQEEAFAAISSPPPPIPVTISVPVAPVSARAVSGESLGRIVSDDERSDPGLPGGHRKPPSPHSQPQNAPPQAHLQKSNGCGHDLPSPDSVSSESSMNNPLSRQKPTIYHDPVTQMSSGTTIVDQKMNPSDPKARVQIQDSGYISHTQFEQQSAQSQLQQQFIQAAAPQYIHHHPSGGVAIPTYIQVYPSQQPQPYPVYYVTTPVPARQPAYNMQGLQSSSLNETLGSLPSSHPQASSNHTMMAPPTNNVAAYNPMRNIPGSKPEIASSGGVYTTASGLSGAQLVQVPMGQQFAGYSQIHHLPHSGPVPGSAANPGYSYEFSDPTTHTQMYFTQPVASAEHQTMTMVLPDGSAAKVQTENVKQQMRSSQPL
ncbi:PREDICTED: uncharacterized protein LOC104805056 [Tarenaya hassleriana]|uniref:uncharacterized protein LOC104805056 n=1 Tax=Tarenaya hassleriana TaxID=28532 RepID=UPI00053C2A3F|nr:PREDICTED: uncharacterized protein LOC104805056 [Tarenaya hassleriana]